jgi:hypothetical protein
VFGLLADNPNDPWIFGAGFVLALPFMYDLWHLVVTSIKADEG